MEQLLGNSHYRAFPLAHLIIPAKEISHYFPPTVIHTIARYKEGQFFSYGAHAATTHNDLKLRQQPEKSLVDGAYLLPAALVEHMDLMPKGKELRLHIITGLAEFIVYIISICPGKHTLLDPQFHKEHLLVFIIITQNPSYCKKKGGQPAVEQASTGC
jgi:hypothetical protein